MEVFRKVRFSEAATSWPSLDVLDGLQRAGWPLAGLDEPLVGEQVFSDAGHLDVPQPSCRTAPQNVCTSGSRVRADEKPAETSGRLSSQRA